MYIRNLVGVTAKILVAALAITLPVSAHDNSSRKFKVTTHDDRGDRSQVVVYSDSLADNGNIYKLFGVPGPPYWHGRWSNGPVAIEDMASILGMPLLDYAYAAATTGLGNLIDGGTPEQLGSLGLPGITTAYNTTIGSIPHDRIRHSLFVVYGGFNDFISDGLTTAAADHAVANLIAIVADLQKKRRPLDLGARPARHGHDTELHFARPRDGRTSDLYKQILQSKTARVAAGRGPVLRYPRLISRNASPSRRIRANGCGRPML
jgi:hypothetical protein